MKTLSALILLLSLSAGAQSQNSLSGNTGNGSIQHSQQRSISENLYFPAAEINLLKVDLEIKTSKDEYRGKLSKARYSTERETQRFNFSFDRGLAGTDLAIHLGTYTGSTTSSRNINGSKQSYKFNGLGNIQAGLTHLSSLSQATNLLLGADASLSPGKSKFAYRNQSGNNYTGGHSVTPSVALESTTPYGNIGGKLSYQYFGRRTTEGIGVIEDEDGGHTLRVNDFSEYKQSNYLLGISAALNMIESGEYNSNVDEKFTYPATQTAEADLYGKMTLSENLFLKPVISYAQLLTKETETVSYDRSDSLSFSLGLGAIF